MKPIECMGSFSEWDKKVRSILLNEILVDQGISFVVNNPLYDEERKDKRCKNKKTPDEILEDLKKRLKRNDDWRAPRKIHLEDLYSLCMITEQTPNYFLLKNVPKESDSEEFLEYLIKDQKTLAQFIGQNITFEQFFKFFDLSNPKLPKIKLPEDEVFLNLFQAQILMRLPKTFHKETQKSVDGAVKAAESKSEHKVSYCFTLKNNYDNDLRQELFIKIIKHAALKNPRATKFIDLGLLNKKYMTIEWTVKDIEKVKNKFPQLFEDECCKRWNAKNRFIVSVNAFLLLCVVAAVVEAVTYQGDTGFTLNSEACNKYVDENIDISSLINELFIHSIFSLGSNVFCAAYHTTAPITISKNPEPVKPSSPSHDGTEELDAPSKRGKNLDDMIPNSTVFQDNSI